MTIDRDAPVSRSMSAMLAAIPGVLTLHEAERASRAVLDAILPEVQAQTLEDFADELDSRYPTDVFVPMDDSSHRSVNDALSGRVERTLVTRDRVSADMMRHAASQARLCAAEYRKAASE